MLDIVPAVQDMALFALGTDLVAVPYKLDVVVDQDNLAAPALGVSPTLVVPFGDIACVRGLVGTVAASRLGRGLILE